MDKKENQSEKENTSFQEKDLDNGKIRAMQEEIEFLREQVESLKQLLEYESQLREDYRQELAHTNQELEWMNEELNNLIASSILPLDEAKELAKSVVEKKESLTESVVELINTTDSFPEEVNKSGTVDYTSITSRTEQIKAQCREAREQSLQIKAKFTQITAQSYTIVGRSRQTRLHSHEIRNQTASAKVFHNASHRHEIRDVEASAC